MSKKMIKRLRSRVGESIAEVLIALLISAVGVAMLSGMVGVSTRMISNSTESMKKEYNKTSVSPSGKVSVTLVDESSKSIDSFSVVNQVHTYSDASGSSKTEIIFYTPAQATSSSTSVSGAG